MNIKFPLKEKIISAQSVYDILNKVLLAEDELDRDKEHFWAIGLTAQNQIKYIDLVHLGSDNQCPCHPMEIYRRACIMGVVSLIVAHNHPSGNPDPSTEDSKATTKLKEAGQVLGIKLLDHVIVGGNGYYSFADEGLI